MANVIKIRCHCEERSDVAIRNILLETDPHGCYADSE